MAAASGQRALYISGPDKGRLHQSFAYEFPAQASPFDFRQGKTLRSSI